MRDVNAIEQHGQLRGIQLHPQCVLLEGWQTEAALLKTLVGEDETARVPGENLHPVPSPRDEDEEVAGVEVFLPLGADERCQPVNAVAHVDGLPRQEDSHGSR